DRASFTLASISRCAIAISCRTSALVLSDRPRAASATPFCAFCGVSLMGSCLPPLCAYMPVRAGSRQSPGVYWRELGQVAQRRSAHSVERRVGGTGGRRVGEVMPRVDGDLLATPFRKRRRHAET